MTEKGTKRYPYFTADTSADVVIARIGADVDPRLREIMDAVIRHAHALVKELRLTQDEWMAAIQFLTRTGQMSSDWRQEFILLSDTLGVSMLVDTLNHGHSGATENTVLGPFYVANPPRYENGHNICIDGRGEPLVIRGRVTDVSGAPIAGATVDVCRPMKTDLRRAAEGCAARDELARRITANAEGEYWFRTAKPRWYPIPNDGPVGAMLSALGRGNVRPAHVHFIVRASGYEDVVTHVFPPDCPYLDSDAVFGVKESLIGDFRLCGDSIEAGRLGFAPPFWTLEWNFVLAAAQPSDRRSGTIPSASSSW